MQGMHPRKSSVQKDLWLMSKQAVVENLRSHKDQKSEPAKKMGKSQRPVKNNIEIKQTIDPWHPRIASFNQETMGPGIQRSAMSQAQRRQYQYDID